MKLNRAQKKCLLTYWFSDYDTMSKKWLLDQEFELKEKRNGWYEVYMNGIKYTMINCSSNSGKEQLETLKMIGD